MFMMSKRAANILPFLLKAPSRFESLQISKPFNAVHTEQISLNNFCANTGIKIDQAKSLLTQIGKNPSKITMLDSKSIEFLCAYYEKQFSFSLQNISENYTERPPIVTIMGHVDHGKTSLLDALRNSNICEFEFGRITQSIGAFSVKATNGKSITFIDTPGHEAFTNLRQRGAKATDLIVIVISIVNGIEQQTVECIKIAQALQIPYIIAFNKVDKCEDVADIEEDLVNHNVDLESYGGNVQAIKISATKKINLDRLLDIIHKEWEKKKCIESVSCMPQCFVIESYSKKDSVLCSASVIVQRGVLRKGQAFICGGTNGKIKSMYDDRQKMVDKASPGQAVFIEGFESYPLPGNTLFGVSDIKITDKILDIKQKIHQEATDKSGPLEQIKIKFNRKERNALRGGMNAILYEKLGMVDESKHLIKAKYRGNKKMVIKSKIDELTEEQKAKVSQDFDFLHDTLTNQKTFGIILKASTAGVLEILINDIQPLLKNESIFITRKRQII